MPGPNADAPIRLALGPFADVVVDVHVAPDGALVIVPISGSILSVSLRGDAVRVLPDESAGPVGADADPFAEPEPADAPATAAPQPVDRPSTLAVRRGGRRAIMPIHDL